MTTLSTKVIEFKKDVARSEMFEVKWDSLSKGMNTTHDVPPCFKVLAASSPHQKLSLVKVSYDPTKAPATFDGFKMNIKFREMLTNVPIMIVKVKMVDNLESEGNGLDVPRVFPETANDESLDCKVCLAPFSDHIQGNVPRILPACGHTICHTCAITIQKMSTNKLSIACPFDRTVTNVIAANLPRNFAIVEIIRERGDKAELTEKLKAAAICEDPVFPCFENPKHESTRHCKTCEVDFCDNCFVSVHSSKIFSSHQFDLVCHRKFRLLRCSIHSINTVSHFCIDKKCKASTPLCCDTCIENLHENHATIPVEKRAEENEEQLTKLLETLNSTEEKTKESLQKAKKNVESLNNSSDEYQGLITTIKLHFEQKKEEAIKKLDDLLDSKKDGLVKVGDDVEQKLEGIKEAKKEIEKVLERKDTLLFTQEIVEKGEAMCKEVNVDKFSMPTLQEIVDSPLPKTPRTTRKLLNGLLPKTWLGSS